MRTPEALPLRGGRPWRSRMARVGPVPPFASLGTQAVPGSVAKAATQTVRRQRRTVAAVVVVLAMAGGLNTTAVAQTTPTSGDCPTISDRELAAPYEYWTALTEDQVRNDYLSTQTGL